MISVLISLFLTVAGKPLVCTNIHIFIRYHGTIGFVASRECFDGAMDNSSFHNQKKPREKQTFN